MTTNRIILLLILLGGVLLRMYRLDRHSIWMDEKVTLLCSQGISRANEMDQDSVFTTAGMLQSNDVAGVIKATKDDNGNAFLYNLKLHFWTGLFGNSDYSIRMLALLFSILCIPLVYALTLRWSGKETTALLAAFFFTVHPLSIGIAQLNRTNTLTTFLCLLATYLLTILLNAESRSRWKWSIAYGIIAGLCLLGHYFSAYILLAHFLILLIRIHRKDWKQWTLPISLVFVFAGIIAGPYLLTAGLEGYRIIRYGKTYFAEIVRLHPEHAADLLLPLDFSTLFIHVLRTVNALFGNYYLGLLNDSQQLPLLKAFPLVYLPLLLLPLAIFSGIFRQKQHLKSFVFSNLETLLLSFSFLAFALLFSLWTKNCLTFGILYSSFTLPYGSILLARLIERTRIPHAAIGKVFIVLAAITFVFFTAVNDRKIYQGMGYANTTVLRDKNPFRKAAISIESSYETGDTVCYWNELDAKLTNLYLDLNTGIPQRFTPEAEGIILLKKGNGQRVIVADVHDKRY